MISWQIIWSCVLFGLLGGFALLAILVTVYGAKDVKSMLESLEDEEVEE